MTKCCFTNESNIFYVTYKVNNNLDDRDFCKINFEINFKICLFKDPFFFFFVKVEVFLNADVL